MDTTATGILLSYGAICVSFILLFTVFIEYMKHFSAYMVERVVLKKNEITAKANKRLIEYGKILKAFNNEELSFDKASVLRTIITTHSQEIQDSQSNNDKDFDEIITMIEDEKHYPLICISILMAVIASQIIYLPPLFDSLFDFSWTLWLKEYVDSEFITLWLISLLLSGGLSISFIHKSMKESHNVGIKTSFRFRLEYICVQTIAFLVVTVFLFKFLQHLFFINIFVFYFMGIFMYTRAYPNHKHKNAEIGLDKNYSDAKKAVKKYCR